MLNVPLLGGGRLSDAAAYQHVAFACPDIFAAARAVRSLGIPTLPVPGNYYDDLAARFDLDAAAAARCGISGCCMTATPAAVSSCTSTP